MTAQAALSWLKGSGEVPVMQLALRCLFSSCDGPVFQTGLGQFTIGTIRWQPSETTRGNIQFEYGNVSVQSAQTGEVLPSPLSEYELKWEVEANGKFVRCTNIDTVVDFMAQVSLSNTLNDDEAVEHVFLEDYVNSMRRALMAKTEAEVRSLWASICETWTAPLRSSVRSNFLSEPVDYHGTACTRYELASAPSDPRDVERTISEQLQSAVQTVDQSCEEITDSGAGHLSQVVSEISSVSRVRWTQRDSATLETSTLRPFLSEHTKDVIVEFRIMGATHFEVTHVRKRMYFIWGGSGSGSDSTSTQRFFESEYAQFFDICVARIAELEACYPPAPRKLECRINDAFDIFDRDGDGRADLSDVTAVLQTINVSEPVLPLPAPELLSAIAGKASTFDFIDFRRVVIQSLLKRVAGEPALNVGALLDMSAVGDLGKFGGKMFRKRWQTRHFVLDRVLGTFSYYAAATDVKPKGAMDLRDYEKCEVNVDPPRGEIFVFDLVPRAGSDAKRYSLAAASDTERSRWIHFINRSIEQADMVAERVELTDAFVSAILRLMSGAIQQGLSQAYSTTTA
eukprot:Amastigsp_a340100_34.p1 type:complete len:569 gc:universal Amastigsp_a340100_34:2695-989(-)